MGVSDGFRFRRRALSLAAALLLPASFLAEAQPLSSAAASSHPQRPTRAVIPPPSGIAPAPVNPAAASRRVAGVHANTDKVVVRSARSERIREVSPESAYDVPLVAIDAYQYAAAVLRRSAPDCHLRWSLVAAIGQVESDHGRFGGATVLTDGTTSPRIVGIALNGRGDVAAIRDTDRGVFDGDKVWDRAVGPLQFLPSTWAVAGVDGDQDGNRNPFDFHDAALATASYLCAGAGDMRVRSEARAAVYRYNHSDAYVDLVLQIAAAYDRGEVKVVSDIVLPEATVPVPLAPGTAAKRLRTPSAKGDGPARPAREAGDARPAKRAHSSVTGRQVRAEGAAGESRKVPGERSQHPDRMLGIDVPGRPTPPDSRLPGSGPDGPTGPPNGGTDSAPDPEPDPPSDPTDPPSDPKPEPPSDPEPDPPSEPTPDPPSDPAPEPPSDPTPEPPPDPAPEPLSDPTPDPPPDPEPDPIPDPGPTPDPDPIPDPGPTPDPIPDPGPTPDPTPDPEPTPGPSPEPLPGPELVRAAGVLTACVDDPEEWCLNDEPLDLGDNPDLSVVQADYDGDTVAEPVVEELTALTDTWVRIATDADGRVLQINRLDYVWQELPR